MTEALGIFQGGGAKGVAHVGALKAAEHQGYEFQGVAGASAGAIIATLIAIGYRADEILVGESPEDNLLARYECSPARIWGKLKLKNFRKNFPKIPNIVFWKLDLGRYLPSIHPETHNARGILKTILLQRYYFDTSDFRYTINRIIKDKVLEKRQRDDVRTDPPDWVCFRHIDPFSNDEFSLLKIIATDINKNCPAIFDYSTPDVVVADAVLASFAMPMVFPPINIKTASRENTNIQFSYDPNGGEYLDGGMVANLPAWALFAEKQYLERGLGAPLPIMAFQLWSQEETHKSEKRFIKAIKSIMLVKRRLKSGEYFKKVLDASVRANQNIPESFLHDLYKIQVRSTLDVLQFDANYDQVGECYIDALGCANLELLDIDERHNSARDYLDFARNKLNGIRKNLHGCPEDSSLHLRAVLIRPVQRSWLSFGIVASSGMEDDADDALELDYRNPGAPLAFQEGRPVYLDFDGKDSNSLKMTKYDLARVRESMASMIAVPVKEESNAQKNNEYFTDEVVGVLAIDSDDYLNEEFDDDKFMNDLGYLARDARKFIIDTPKEF